MADSELEAPTAGDGDAGADTAASRRLSARRHVLKSGMIFCDDDRTMRCHILNISETGALLMPSKMLSCPNEFVLKPSDAPSRHCVAVWRDETTMGVRYLPAERAVVTNVGAAIRIALYRGETELGAVDLAASDAVGFAGRLIEAAYRRLVS